MDDEDYDTDNIVARYIRSAHQVSRVNIRDFLELHHSPPTQREMFAYTKKQAIKMIDRISAISQLTEAEVGNTQCAICLEELNATFTMRRLHFCRHIFCQSCIQAWFNISKTCPICKHAEAA